MDPIHLRPDELAYELDVRSIFGLTSQRLKTAKLREILKREETGIEVCPRHSSNMFSPDDELEICENNVCQLKGIIQDAIHNGKSLIIVESEHRLLHYRDRLRRITSTTMESKNKNNQLCAMISSLSQSILLYKSMGRQRKSLPPEGASSLVPTHQGQRLNAQSENNIRAQSEVAERFEFPRPLRSLSPSMQRSIDDARPPSPRISPVVTPEIFEHNPNTLYIRSREANKTNGTQLPPIISNSAVNSKLVQDTQLRNQMAIPRIIPDRQTRSNFDQHILNTTAHGVHNMSMPNQFPNYQQQIQFNNAEHQLSLDQAVLHNRIDNIMSLGNQNYDDGERYRSQHTAFPTGDLNRFDHVPQGQNRDRINRSDDYVPDFRNDPGYRQMNFRNNNPAMNRKSIPVNQWRLTFSGDGRGSHLYSFLSEITLLQRSERMSDDDIMCSIIHLLSGRARTWYLSTYEMFRTWQELVAAMKREFLPSNYDFSLFNEISNRRQRANESFGEYITQMLALFKWINIPISEEHKLYMVQRNLQPKYAIGIAPLEIRSLRQLSEICRRIDNVTNLNNRPNNNLPFDPTNQNNRNQYPRAHNINEIQAMQYPDFGLQIQEEGRNHREAEVYAMARGNSCQNNQNVQPTNTRSNVNRCYNCEQPGHHFNGCREERRGTFCYLCGSRNVTVRNCEKCSGNGRRDSVAQGPPQSPSSGIANPLL